MMNVAEFSLTWSSAGEKETKLVVTVVITQSLCSVFVNRNCEFCDRFQRKVDNLWFLEIMLTWNMKMGTT